MRCPPKAKTRRLLCVLFLRLGPLSAGPGHAAVTARHFPPPWAIEELNDACFIVRDHNGQACLVSYNLVLHCARCRHYCEKEVRIGAGSLAKYQKGAAEIGALPSND